MNPLPQAAKSESNDSLLQAAFAPLPSDPPPQREAERRKAVAQLELARRLDEANRERRQLLELLEERKQAQAALSDAEARWRFALDGAGDGIWDWDVATGAVFYSKRWKSMLGYEEHELEPTVATWENLIHPDDRAEAMALLKAHFRGETDSSIIEHRLRCKDGSWRWVMARGKVMDWQAPGQPRRMIGTHTDIHESKLQREAQHSLTRRLDLALQAGRLGTFEHDFLAHTASWDTRAWEIMGLEPSEGAPSQSTLESILLPADLPTWQSVFGPRRAARVSMSAQIRVALPTGEIRTVVCRALYQEESEGLVTRMTGVLEDVSERLAAEAQRREALKLYNTVFNSVAEGLTLQRADDVIIDCNPAAESILGLTRNQLLGLDSFDPRWQAVDAKGDHLPPSLHPSVVVVTTNRPVRGFEMGVIRIDGSRVYLLVNAEPIRNAAGRITHVVASFSDVTSQRRAEEERRRADERLRAAVIASRIVWWEWAIERKNFTVSASGAECILGYEPCDLSTRNDFSTWLDRTHPDERTDVEASLRLTLSGEAPEWRCDHRLKAADGTWRWVRNIGRVTERAPDGAPLRMIGTTQDTQADHDADDRRRELEAQLAQSQRLETLGTLAGGIAHDFNNILTGLIGFVELSLDAVQSGGSADDLLIEARNCGLRARDLVKRLLLFSRRSPDTFRRSIQLDQLVAESHRLISATLPTSIQITTELPPDLPPVEVDPAQIQQVLMNLCVNAAHAIGPKQGHLAIALRSETLGPDSGLSCPAGRYVCLQVADDGCGMDEATRARIYDPFYTTKPVGEGTGLGLAMVHGIIASHGGAIRLASTLHVGTTFEVFLPVSAAPTLAPASSAPPFPSVNGNQRTILLADDEEAVRLVVATVLERAGFRVQACEDGNAALACFHRQPDAYALALLDLSMPGMTGNDLIQELHAVRPGLPVVLMSGDHDRYGASSTHGLPAVERLPKPFSAEELQGAIARALPVNA